MSEPANNDIEIIDQVLMPEPILTEEQGNNIYCVVCAGFQVLLTEDANGKEVLAFARGLLAKEAPIRVINSIYKFVTSSKPGEYLWIGHLTPMFFHTNKNKIEALVPKDLNAT